MPEASDEEAKVIIVGAGVIGASVAYHLAKRGVRSTIIEKCGVACASSGKAGGFLAYDWCDRDEVGLLARPSFKMHEKLSKELGRDVNYRKLDTYSTTLVGRGGSKKRNKASSTISWVDGDVQISGISRLGSTTTTAQVHPRKLTEAFIDAAEEKCGTKVVIGKVIGVDMDGRRVKAVNVEFGNSPTVRKIRCSTLILTLGPWSFSGWFEQIPPVLPQKAASIVVEGEVGAQALFTLFIDKGQRSEPEVYPRPDGTVYICGSAQQEPLPDDPKEIHPHSHDTGRLKKFARVISRTLAENEESATEQACYLPGSPDGIPIIGKVPDTDDVYIATGHSCWGILNSPATGAAMADLVVDGKSDTIDVRPFSPSRFKRAVSPLL